MTRTRTTPSSAPTPIVACSPAESPPPELVSSLADLTGVLLTSVAPTVAAPVVDAELVALAPSVDVPFEVDVEDPVEVLDGASPPPEPFAHIEGKISRLFCISAVEHVFFRQGLTKARILSASPGRQAQSVVERRQPTEVNAGSQQSN